MTPIGETLRRERLRRNLDLIEISNELKIAPHLLEAIEAERFERLPGGVFAKSFVRQYARLLGLDGDEIAAEVARTMEPPPELKPAERPDLPPLAGLRLPSMEAWRRVGEGHGGWSSWVTSAAVIVIVTLACSAIYVLWDRGRTPSQERRTAAVRTGPAQPKPAQPEASQPPAAATEPAAPFSGSTEPAAPAAPPAQPAPAEQNPSGATGLAERAAPDARDAAAPSSGNAIPIQITADEPVWVRATNNGKYLFSETLNPNQTRTLDAEGAVELRLGNAGGVEIQLNGKPIGTVGPKGQVRTVQLTSGGFKIESPSKPAAPPAPL